MSDEKRIDLDEVLDAAIDLPADERKAFIVDACGGDEAAESEALSLLRAYESADDFLEKPVTVPAELAAQQDWSGQTIASYHLLEEIGAGGMGRVFLAERSDRDFEQRVAIKLIPRGVMGEETIRRFRNECRVLAMLEHPNIARMIDGGLTDDGVPYIVMEYVDGEPIHRYCANNALSVEARLDIFRQVCAAVQVVHQHSTIHRDIKPSNILVTSDGQAKLVDFGIARVLDIGDDMEQTATGFEVMTPRYASPEQIRGDVLSTATDIYSLGVVLYELLTGRPPFESDNRRKLENEITDTAPTRPSEMLARETAGPDASRLAKKLKGDIDTIVLMALRKEPERRYSSAQQFADDIRRHLKGQPVIAQADTFAYRARKFVGRNTAAVAAASVLAAVLIGSTVLSLTLYNRAETARQHATIERAASVSTSDFLQDLLATADPSAVETRADITVRSALDWAARRLETELSDQPRVAAGLHSTIGRAYMNLGVLDDAREHMDQALALYESAAPRDDEQITQVHIIIGQLLEKSGSYEEAEKELRVSLEVAEQDGFDPAIRAENELSLARVYSGLMNTEQAESFARRAVATSDLIEDPQSLLHTQTRSELGVALYRAGKYDDAAQTIERAVATARETLGSDHVLVGETLNNLAVTLNTMGRTEDAIKSFEECLQIYEAIYPENHPEFGTTHLNLADALNRSGRYEECIAMYKQSIEEFSVIHGDDYVMIGLAENGIGTAERELGNTQAAREHYVAALEILVPGLGNGHPWLATVRNNLARVHHDLGENEDAERVATAALQQMRAQLPEGHHHLSRPLALLAQIHLDRGDYATALPYAQEAADVCRNALDPDDEDRVKVEALLAECEAGGAGAASQN